MESILLIGIPVLLSVGAIGVSVTVASRNKVKKASRTASYKAYFPDAYSDCLGMEVYPISRILLSIMDESEHMEPWMSEVKRYEGNRIESPEVQKRFWLNMLLLNEKYALYRQEWRGLDSIHRFESDSYILNANEQLEALKQEVLQRCHDCYQLMKADGIEERQARLAVPLKTEEMPELHTKPFIGSEEKALLRILESPEATPDMKQEAGRLLMVWQALSDNSSVMSAEEESMRTDLLTIRNIIEGKKVGNMELPVLKETSKP